MPYKTVIKTGSRVLPLPKAPDLGERFAKKLVKVRKHRKRAKWTEPTDAELILHLHFRVQSLTPHVYHADATLEIPTGKADFNYYSIYASDKTRAGALRSVIEQMESSKWFHHFRSRGVRFQITGAGMEELYRGYL